jgi:hypothetical protein
MKQLLISVVAVVAASLVANAQQSRPSAPTALRQNIGKALCNATNGVLRGRIVDVALYSAAGQAGNGCTWLSATVGARTRLQTMELWPSSARRADPPRRVLIRHRLVQWPPSFVGGSWRTKES